MASACNLQTSRGQGQMSKVKSQMSKDRRQKVFCHSLRASSLNTLPPREKERAMINVGVIGLGMMGQTHLDVYAKRADVRVVAVADRDPARLAGKVRAAGNVEGQAQG